MKTFKRILIGMDHTQTDLELLDYVKMLHPIQKPEKIYCAHVVKVLELPSFVKSKNDEFIFRPLDERLKKNLEDSVHKKLRPGQYDVSCDILEGKVDKQLLHWAEIKGIDLSVLGRKTPASGTGVSAKRFLRKSTSSVLFVPHRAKHKIKKIVLATDFSKTSTYSLLKILAWTKKLPGEVTLSLIHVYDIPFGVNRQLGDVPQLLIDKIKKTTEEFASYYLSELNIPKEHVELRLVANNFMNPGNYVYQEAKNLKADLLVMGAQGHAPWENFIVGSVSEKVLGLNVDIPFLILRPTFAELEKLPSYSIINFQNIDHA